MRKMLLAFMLVFLLAVSIHAQQIQIPRDYAVINPSVSFSPDNTTFTVQFTIRNSGGADPSPTTIRIVNLIDNSTMSEDTLASIASGGSVTVQVPFVTANFPTGDMPIEIEVGIDAVEPADSPISDNNTTRISISIPANVGTPTTATNNSATPDLIQYTREGVTVFGTYLDYNTVLSVGVGVLIGLIVLWLLTIIFRWIFRKTPEFNAWQPSYANMPLLDPNSTEGRRQAWQTHAQNSLILAAPTQGNLHPIKVLIGTDGETLSNWKVIGLRISQYDNYGRVSRSQVIASRKIINQLNGIIKRRAKTQPEKLQKQVNGLSRTLINQFKRNLNAKSAFLPIALDLRFEGRHGEIRILFELYQAQAGMWYRLDQWEPVMAIASRTIVESYTYTIHGMSPSEKLKDYSARLTEDMTWLLAEMLRVRMPIQPQQPVDYNVPDTLTDMKPITI